MLRGAIHIIASIVMMLCILTQAHGSDFKISAKQDPVRAINPVKLSEKLFANYKLQAIEKNDNQETPYAILMNEVMSHNQATKRLDIQNALQEIIKNKPKDYIALKDYFDISSIQTKSLSQNPSFIRLNNTCETGEGNCHLSSLLLSVLYLKRDNIVRGLDYANQALETIPNNIEATERYRLLYYTNTVLLNGFILDKSTVQALETTERLIDLSNKSKITLDPYSTSNNIAVLYSYQNEIPRALEILETATDYLKDANPEMQMLHYYTKGNMLNKIGDHEKAVQVLKTSLTLNPPDIYIPFLYSQLAISYSNLGSTGEAKNLLNKIENLPDNQLNDTLKHTIERLRYTIAYNSGEYKKALNHYKKWSQAEKEKLNQEVFTNRKNTALKIATSSKVSQQKLEHLETKTMLQKTIIEKKTRTHKFIAALGLLTLLIMTMLAYGITKLKETNTIITEARDKAIAGEKAKSEFLAMMSHEIRTPLNGIIPLAEQLIRTSKKTDEVKLLKIIKTSGEQMFNMLENIMITTEDTNDSLNEEYYTDVNIRDILNEALNNEKNEIKRKNLIIKASTKRRDLTISGSQRHLSVLISNLISNAVKFTQRGKIEIMLSGDFEHFDITISDTGEGINIENLPELLNPFNQNDTSMKRQHGGIGLGLSVANKICSKIGATMQINNNKENGTTVKLSIPITKPLQKAA